MCLNTEYILLSKKKLILNFNVIDIKIMIIIIINNTKCETKNDKNERLKWEKNAIIMFTNVQ